MDYNLLICASTKEWTAIDINTDGGCDRISFDGNETAEVDKKNIVEYFCTQILNYYNIDNFDDIDFNIKVVVVSEYSSLITDLFMHIKEAKNISIIDAKSIIPIYVLKNCIVKPGSTIDLKCMEEKFTLQVDDNLVVSYTTNKAGQEIIMEPESFSILFRFDCNNLISDESELKALEKKCIKDEKKKQKEIDEQKKRYSELKKEYEALECCYIKLQEEMEASKTKFDDKRVIHRFSVEKLESAYILGKQIAFEVDFVGGLWGKSVVNKKYICKLKKADGDIVKKGSSLLEISEMRSVQGCAPTETGRKCIIKADGDGRVFFLVKNDDVVSDNEAVVIVSDPADKKSDIMKWYKEIK